MKIALVLLFALTLPATAADGKKIGVVKDMKGEWCRKAARLKKDDALYWEDDVRYCSRRVAKVDQVTVVFDSVPPYERTYACSTPGICDQQAKLWLQGAYEYHEPASGHLTSLISSPNLRGSSIPDAIVRAGADGLRLPEDVLSAVAGDFVTICRVSGDEPTDCAEANPTRFNPIIRVGPGLYGIYRLSPMQNRPSALLLVVPANSDLPERWELVPEPFRQDSDPASVKERRLFLLDLYKSAK